MKVGIDARLPALAPGGISEYAVNLIRALAECDSRNDYSIVQMFDDPLPRLPLGRAGFRRVDSRVYCHEPDERSRLGRELLALDLEVFHSPDYIPPIGGARRRVINVHDISFLLFPEHQTRESRAYYAGQIAQATAEANAILTSSEIVRRDIVERCGVPPEKIEVIPMAARAPFGKALDPERSEEARRRYALPDRFALFVGTLEPRKNIPFLLRAVELTAERYGWNVPIVLVGRWGWNVESIRASMVAFRGRLIAPGHIPDDDLAAIYQAADCLLFPSLYEGFGLPAVEAMACGCPVLASCHGGLPEVVGDAGIVLDTRDPGDWTDALAHVVTDDEWRRRLSAASKARAAQFSWRRTAERTLDVYERIAAT